MELEIVHALTWARTSPREVIDALRDRSTRYEGMEYYPKDRKKCVVTKEGVAVVHEAIEYVEGCGEMGGVGDSLVRGLSLAAEDHVCDIGFTGTASHASSDGTTSSERASRYGSFRFFGECLWYGSDQSDARTMVLDLIVDDGVPSRGHRKGVLNPRFNMVGVHYGPHITFGRVAAMELATDYQDDAMFIRARERAGPVKIDPRIQAQATQAATTQWSLGACSLCKQGIKGGRVVDIPLLGGKLHADCFQCKQCATPLAGGAYKVHAGKPFCTACFGAQHGEACVACGEVITGRSLKCGLGSFHADCARCSSCGCSVGGKFSTASGAILCSGCSGIDSRSRAPLQTAAKPKPASERPLPSSRPSSRPGSRLAVAKAKGTPLSASASPKAPSPSRAKAPPAAKPKARPKGKAASPASLAAAGATVVGLGMDYGSLE